MNTLAFVIALVVVLPNARAFEESRTEYGARLRLISVPARVRLDKPVPGFSDGGRAALLRAIGSWNVHGCSSPLLVLTDEEDDALIEIVPISEGWKFGAAIAAHTAVESEPFRGDIRHVVIEIDTRRPWAQGDGVSVEAIDLESVFLHELGHAIGLDHSRNGDAVMRSGIKPGQIRRELHKDDIAGICTKTRRPWFGESNSLGSVITWLWQAPAFFAMILFFVVGLGVVGVGIVRMTLTHMRPIGSR